MFRKSEGHSVKYLESRGTDELKQLMTDQGRDPKVVEEIDFLLDREKSLSEMVEGETFDWVVSSHVIEHIPDTITHLRDVTSILSEGGVYALLIPDRNYCFDCLKPASTLGMFVEAFLQRRTQGTIRSFVDETRYGARPEGVKVGGWTPAEVSLPLQHKTPNWRQVLKQMIMAEGENAKNSFVHQWHYDPITFPQIVADLIDLDLIQMELVAIQPTYHMDFMCVLRKTTSPMSASAKDIARKTMDEYIAPTYDYLIK
ncbi:class I SAM-dependent methyltransferase [Jiella marina]|uniref:class I SAM-dependent methyltransferase n=1 Tax=Jiella sp. LLJ827 TaxID=2917712 RepID=UPI0021010E43|nr:class I SAM-dependent methyltransferase [Jiella sp. LLJ827]MCQ0987052.1 class I SAM-dependent methyltransferase [Jiella sp. LLJ827]